MNARTLAVSSLALLLGSQLRAEGLSSAESQALLDVTIEVCSKADTAKPGRYELLLEPPYACNRQDPRIVALSRARPEYREFSLKVRKEFAAMPQAELLAMCQSMFEAMCEREPEQAAPATQR
jgi:hypothetical protein